VENERGSRCWRGGRDGGEQGGGGGSAGRGWWRVTPTNWRLCSIRKGARPPAGVPRRARSRASPLEVKKAPDRCSPSVSSSACVDGRLRPHKRFGRWGSPRLWAVVQAARVSSSAKENAPPPPSVEGSRACHHGTEAVGSERPEERGKCVELVVAGTVSWEDVR